MFITGFSFNSCNLDFSHSKQPHYVYLDTIGLKTNLLLQGYPTHKITECWLYADGSPVGAFNSHKLIPILSDYKTINLTLYAGIRSNGSKNSVEQYYLMSPINITVNNYPGKIDTLNAFFEYDPEVNFSMLEDFENGNIFNEDLDDDPITKMTRTSENYNTGSHSGLITLNAAHKNCFVSSSLDYYKLPIDGRQIFLELNYKNDNDFIIGIKGKNISTGQSFNQDFILLKPKSVWTKIYLNLTSDILNSGLGYYKIYFNAAYNGSNTETKIFIDDVKLLYLNK